MTTMGFNWPYGFVIANQPTFLLWIVVKAVDYILGEVRNLLYPTRDYGLLAKCIMNSVTIDRGLTKLLIQTYQSQLTHDQILAINRFAFDQDCPESLIIEDDNKNKDDYLIMAVITDAVNCWLFLDQINSKSSHVATYMFEFMKQIYIDPSKWSPKIFKALHDHQELIV